MKVTKSNVQRLLSAFVLLSVVVLMAACGKKKIYDVDYLAVQYEKDQQWSIIDASGKVIISEEYDKDAQVSVITDGVFWVKDKKGYQLFSIDNPKKPLIDEYFKSATRFVNGYSFVSKDGTAIEVLDSKGKTVKTLPANITMVYTPSAEGYVCYYDANKKLCGLLDEDGDVVLEAQYTELTPVREGVAMACKKGDTKIFFINPKGEVQASISAEKYGLVVLEYAEGLLPVVAAESESKEVMYLDKKGEKVLTLKKSHYDEDFYRWLPQIGYAYIPYMVHNGYVVYGNDNGKYGVADKNGEILIRAKYDKAYSFVNEGFVAYKNKKWGLIDAQDMEILDFDYEEIAGITVGGNYLVKKDGFYSIIDKEAKRVGKDEFYDVSCFMCDNAVCVISMTQIVTELTSPLTADSYDGITADDKPAKVAKIYNVDNPRTCLHSNNISRTDRLNREVRIENTCYFNSYISEEQDNEKYAWVDASAHTIEVEFYADSDASIDTKAVLTAVIAELKKKGFTADEEFDMQDEYYMKGKGAISGITIVKKYQTRFSLTIQFKTADTLDAEPLDELWDGYSEFQPDDDPANQVNYYEDEFQPDDDPANKGA